MDSVKFWMVWKYWRLGGPSARVIRIRGCTEPEPGWRRRGTVLSVHKVIKYQHKCLPRKDNLVLGRWTAVSLLIAIILHCLHALLTVCLSTVGWSVTLKNRKEWGPGTKISPGGATVIRNRKFAPYWRSPLRQMLRICFVQMNISNGPFPNCERSWEEGMCACREEKKTSSPGKMHVLRTHFSTSRHTTLRHFHCIKINAEDSLLRFHKVKPVGLSKLPVPLTVAPPGESAIVPGPH